MLGVNQYRPVEDARHGPTAERKKNGRVRLPVIGGSHCGARSRGHVRCDITRWLSWRQRTLLSAAKNALSRRGKPQPTGAGALFPVEH